PPLPTGFYDITANTKPGLRAWEGGADVKPKGCSLIQLEFEIDGRLSGHINRPDGKPFKRANVIVVSANQGDSYTRSETADEKGDFEIAGLAPGRYLLGVNAVRMDFGTTIFYPGVKERALAAVFEIGEAERRTGINFKLP